MRLVAALVLLLFCGCGFVVADPVISEFMAANVTTLKDGHDNYEDWVEIWNPAAAPVDLAGWRLTDSASDPAKFVFPPKVLAAGGRVVVFCSGRGGSTGALTHVDELGNLHTNFSLAKQGEFLALIKPDGSGATTAFSPAYPQQVDDISYGSREATAALVDESTTVRSFVPTSASPDTAATNWRLNSFVDTSWKPATGSGLGFESGSPVGVWTFDDAPGSTAAADATGSGQTAVLNGTGQTFGAAGHTALTKGAIAFDGNGGLTVPYSAKLNPPSAFTFAAWVFPIGGSGHRVIVSSRTSHTGQQRGFSLALNAANTWEFSTGTGTTPHVLAGGPAAMDEWTHVAITRSTTGTKRIYINGVQAAGASGGYSANADPSHGFHLGTGDDTGSNYRFVGRLDDAAFFPAELDGLLVTQHRDNGAGSFPTPLYPAHYQNDLQTAMATVNPGVYTRHRFTVADIGLLASLRLRVKFDDAFVAYVNGVEVARRNFAGTREFNSVADTDRSDTEAVVFDDVDISAAGLPALVNGANMLAIHGFRRSLTHEDFLLVPRLEATLLPAAQTSGYFAVATPGTVNGGAFVDPGPAIGAVTHTPAEPTVGESVTVTAQVTPRLAPIASVALIARVMYNAELPAIAMTDAGPAPGATDGTRLFTGEIPNAGGATVRRMLRYSLTATDTGGRTWRAPYPVDLTNADGVSQSPQYFGLVVRDPALVAGMPILQWFTSDVSNSDTRTGSRASVYYAGRFYDNIYVRQRGGYTSASSQKFNFNAGDGIVVNETLGRVGEVNMNGPGADQNYYRVPGSYDMLRTSGHPACESFNVAMYRNGTFQRMGILIEQVDEDYLKRWGYDPDGSMYKFVQRLGETPLPGGDYSNTPGFGDTLYGIEKKTRLHEGMADLEAFVAGINNGTPEARETFLFKQLNLPNFINFMAMRPLIADSDTNRKNFYFYRDSDGSREWFLFPWDKDGTMNTTINPWQATIAYKAEASTTKQWNVLWEQAYQSLEIRAMVGRRLRTLMDTMMGPTGTPAGTSVLEQRMAAVRSTMTPLPPGVTITNYNNISSWNTWLGRNRTWLYTTYGPSSVYGMIPTAAGAAVGVSILSADPNPASGRQDLEHLVIRNAGTEAVDLSGWTLDGGGIHHTFKSGTVIVGTATISTLNQAVVCNDRAAFRSRAGAPATAEFILGDYDGVLSARGGTVELRDAAGSVVSSYSLPVAPSPAQTQLRITKLMYAPTPPTVEELAVLPTAEPEDFEYLEVHNLGATALDLAGCRFTDGIDYVFPAGTQLGAGARLVIAENPAAFDRRYGAGLHRLGPYAGALDNSGERIRLVDAVGEEILDFTYSPEWFPSSDQSGYALIMRDATTTDYADWGLPEKWALSGTVGGAPTETPGFFSYEYAGWKNYHFTGPERADSAISGPAAVSNSTQVNNLLAFALGLDPRSPDLARLPQLVTTTTAGQSYAALRLRRWKSAPGLDYSLEGTSLLDGGSWEQSAIVAESVDNDDGTLTITLRDTLPIPGQNSRFLRLKVTLQQ